MKAWLAGTVLLLALALCGAVAIEKVSIAADFPLDAERLKQAASLRAGDEYDPAALQASIEAMHQWLQKQGHPFVSIPNPELIPLTETGLELAFTLSERLPADRMQVSFRGLKFFTEAKLRDLLLLPRTKTLGIAELPALMASVLEEYQRRGYLFAAVELDSLVLKDGLEAHLGISEGKPFRLEKVYFQGNRYTRDKTLLKLSGLSQNAVVTPDLLSAAEAGILRKSYISSCLVEPIDSGSLLIKVQEGKMTFLEGIAGLARRDGKNELTGTLNLNFLNLWGSDRAIALHWQKNPRNDVLQFSYHESGPANFPLAADLSLYRNVRDTLWIKSTVGADIYSYHAGQRYGLHLASEGISPGSGRPIQFARTASRSVGAFWQLDSRDNPVNPAHGSQTGFRYLLRNADSGKRWSNALEADHAQYLGLSPRWTLALGAHLRSLAAADTTQYLLYAMGGFNSLRGYREDELASWRLGWGSLELRYRIGTQSRIYLFYDHGLLMEADERFRSDLLAPGIGLKVNTRLGILSIEYALGYRDQGFPELGAGMVHAGIDTSF